MSASLSMVHHNVKPYIPNGQGCPDISPDRHSNSTSSLLDFANTCSNEFSNFLDTTPTPTPPDDLNPRASTPLTYSINQPTASTYHHHHQGYQPTVAMTTQQQTLYHPSNNNSYTSHSNSSSHTSQQQPGLLYATQELTPATMINTESNCSASISSDSDTTGLQGMKRRKAAPTLATGRRNLKCETVEPDEADRRCKRRERNRKSAQKCRERKVSMIEELKGQIDNLKDSQLVMQQELGGILDEARRIFQSVQQRCTPGQNISLPYFNCLSEALNMTSSVHPPLPAVSEVVCTDIKPPPLIMGGHMQQQQASPMTTAAVGQPHHSSPGTTALLQMSDTPPNIMDQTFWPYYPGDTEHCDPNNPAAETFGHQNMDQTGVCGVNY